MEPQLRGCLCHLVWFLRAHPDSSPVPAPFHSKTLTFWFFTLLGFLLPWLQGLTSSSAPERGAICWWEKCNQKFQASVRQHWFNKGIYWGEVHPARLCHSSVSESAYTAQSTTKYTQLVPFQSPQLLSPNASLLTSLCRLYPSHITLLMHLCCDHF